ncbi:MAG: SAM-dependent methyltransferase [Spirochaetota bacterium]
MSHSMGHGELVRQYYDESSRLFLRFGPGRGEGAIHRPVWAQGINNRRDAVKYANEQILSCLRDTEAQNVLDLGCGVGGTIAYLATRHSSYRPIRYTGITVSPYQAATARERFQRLDKKGDASCTVLAGDFMNSDSNRVMHNSFDLMYAIEAFAHADSANAFFRAASVYAAQGCTLVLIDDYLKRRPATGSDEYRRLLRYKWGWRVPSIMTPDELVRTAADHGFVLDYSVDWTAEVSRHGVRDYLLRFCAPLLELGSDHSEWCRSMVGGDALKRLLVEDVIGYGLFRFSLKR